MSVNPEAATADVTAVSTAGLDRRRPSVLMHFSADPDLKARLAPHLDGLDMVWCAESDEPRLESLIGDIDVWWHVLKPITAEHLARARRLKLIQKLGSGVDTIDLAAANRHGVQVANMVGMNAQAVAESALGLIMAVSRRIVRLDAMTRAGQGWPLDPMLAVHVPEIAGSTVGLVGFGEIARRLAEPLRALGARVLHTTSTRRDERDWRPLDELLADSDIVSLHVPLTESTRGLINRRRLSLMRRGSIIVNTSRGAIVDEAALVDALSSGHVGGAGLDVFSHEPVDRANPLLSAPNVVVTPHVGWLTLPSLERCVAFAADNVRRLAAGAPLKSVVYR